MHSQSLPELQRLSKRLGYLFGGIAASMTFTAGWQLGGDSLLASLLIATGLAAVTVLVAILLTFADFAWHSGHRILAGALGLFWAVCLVTEYGSHVMFTVGHRASNEQAANVQDAVYSNAQKGVAENEALLASFRDRLDKLQAANPWSAAVTADALRAKLAAMEGDKVFKRSKACANVTLPESRTFCDKRAELQGQIAIAEESTDLTKQIEATKKVLDDARTKAAATTKGDSLALTQSQMVASLATVSLDPSSAAVRWAGYGIGAFVSLVFSFAAATCIMLAFKDWGTVGLQIPRTTSAPATAAPGGGTATAPSAPSSGAAHITIDNIGSWKKELYGALAAHGLIAA